MKRFRELDFFRGVAVVLMVIYHGAFDLDFFKIVILKLDGGVWGGMAFFVQIIFVVTTGMTLAISYESSLNQGQGFAVWRRLRHASFIFGWGMVITLVTWILFKEVAVKFGILHFLGVSMVLALPFLFLRKLNGWVGLGVIVADWMLKDVVVDYYWGFPLGFTAVSFKSLDYFPLFPWFGLFLMGVAMGFYWNDKKWSFRLKMKLLEWIGRHSLAIYLVHQPLLVVVIWFIFNV